MKTKTPTNHPLEENIVLSDGTTATVTGLLAIKYRNNPEGVRKFLDEEKKRKGK